MHSHCSVLISQVRYYLIPSTGFCAEELYAPSWINNFFNQWADCCRTSWIVSQCLAADPGTTALVVEQPVIVQQVVQTTTTSTTASTTTTVKVDELETIPFRFSLLGLPMNIDDKNDFKDAMTRELKIALTSAAERFDVKVTNFKTNIFNRQLRSLQSDAEQTQTIKLYYDLEVVKDPSQKPATALIQAIRDRRDQVLGDLQASTSHYLSNFDLCATSSSGLYDDSDFDVCTLNHEIVPVTFSANKLHPDVDQEDLNEELLKIYSDILSKVNGLEVASLSLKKVDQTSSGHDVFFDIDVIDTDGSSWRAKIESELEKEATQTHIFEKVREYLINSLGAGVEGVDVCVDEQGVISMECASIKSSRFKLPTWAIIAIASASAALALGICISICICTYQDAKDEQDMKYSINTFVKDPEEWRQGMIRESKKRVAPTTPHRRRKERRSRRKSPRRLKYHRERSPRRRRSTKRIKHREHRERETLPALPPPLLALPPPPESPPQQFLALPAPPPQNMYNYDQSHSTPENILAIEGPVYCDDEEVNRPDPPMEPGPTPMLMNRPSHGSGTSEDSSSYLAIMPDPEEYRGYH